VGDMGGVMIHGTAVFSVADLRDMSGILFGKIKYNRRIINVKIIEEMPEEEMTIVEDMKKQEIRIKTKKIFDYKHYDKEPFLLYYADAETGEQ
jgi:hypothetical protein